MLAQQILRVGQSQCKFSASLGAAEKLGMGDAILLYLLQKFLLYRVLAYYVAEKHSVRSLFLVVAGAMLAYLRAYKFSKKCEYRCNDLTKLTPLN